MKNKYSKRRKGLKIVNEEQKSVFSQRFENQNIWSNSRVMVIKLIIWKGTEEMFYKGISGKLAN